MAELGRTSMHFRRSDRRQTTIAGAWRPYCRDGSQVTTHRKGNDMQNLDAVVCDLEWQRLRRRVALNPAEAMLLNCGTWAVIAFLKLVSR